MELVVEPVTLKGDALCSSDTVATSTIIFIELSFVFPNVTHVQGIREAVGVKFELLVRDTLLTVVELKVSCLCGFFDVLRKCEEVLLKRNLPFFDDAYSFCLRMLLEIIGCILLFLFPGNRSLFKFLRS